MRIKTEYACMCCRYKFAIEITDRELHGRLKPGHWEACPECGRRVGTGPIQCRSCGKIFAAVFPHSHVQCDLTVDDDCPACGVKYGSFCMC
jgi:hypothetical protein